MNKPINFRGVRRYLFADTSSLKSEHHLPRIFFFVALLLFLDLHCPLSRQQRVMWNVEGHALCFLIAFAVVFHVVALEESMTGWTASSRWTFVKRIFTFLFVCQFVTVRNNSDGRDSFLWKQNEMSRCAKDIYHSIIRLAVTRIASVTFMIQILLCSNVSWCMFAKMWGDKANEVDCSPDLYF